MTASRHFGHSLNERFTVLHTIVKKSICGAQGGMWGEAGEGKPHQDLILVKTWSQVFFLFFFFLMNTAEGALTQHWDKSSIGWPVCCLIITSLVLLLGEKTTEFGINVRAVYTIWWWKLADSSHLGMRVMTGFTPKSFKQSPSYERSVNYK